MKSWWSFSKWSERGNFKESDRGIHFRGEATVLLVLEEERALEAEQALLERPRYAHYGFHSLHHLFLLILSIVC